MVGRLFWAERGEPAVSSRKNVLSSLEWLDYHVLLRLFSLLPLRWAYAAGRIRAYYRHSVRTDAREAARRHMRETLPELSQEELDRYVREFFYSPCLDELEGYFLPGLSSGNLGKLIDVEGRDHLERCLERKRGAIVFSTHSAGVAVCLAALGLMGFKTNVVGRSLDEEDNPLPWALRTYARRRVKCIEGKVKRPFLAPARGNSKILAQRLRDNELVFVLLDVPPEIVRQKVVVKFLGRDSLFPSGFARIAMDTGCGLVPLQRFYEAGWARQRLVFGEAIYSSEDIQQDVQTCVSIAERMILQHPSQWWVWDNLSMLRVSQPETSVRTDPHD